MRKLVLLAAAIVMAVPMFGGSASSDPAGDFVYTCGPNPSPEPYVADLCLPDSVPNGDWSLNGSGQPVVPGFTCTIDESDPEQIPGINTSVADNDVNCPQPAYQLSISEHIIWTTCKRHDGTTCQTHTNENPHNPDGPVPCNYCRYRSATATMYGPHPYCHYYWAHTVARRQGASTYSHWTDPILLCL